MFIVGRDFHTRYQQVAMLDPMERRDRRAPVIQRTFVGRDLPAALFAASVPLNEVRAKSLLEGDTAGFRALVLK